MPLARRVDACRGQPLGGTLVVWRLDYLGPSKPHMVDLVEELIGKGIGFRSLLNDVTDTASASGELMFHIFPSQAQFERWLIQERQHYHRP
ncbi:MAG: recombinase family protein [Candidatus Tectomicrobia bacterium]|nr:recombinase family protein [Candidatus Tectomicrobia bacterium]